jgi:hypothetical protein
VRSMLAYRLVAGCFFNSARKRHPERSLSQICLVTQCLWRGVEEPWRCLSQPRRPDLFNHRNAPRGSATVFPSETKLCTYADVVHEVEKFEAARVR